MKNLKTIQEIIDYIGPVNPLNIHHSLFEKVVDYNDFRETIKTHKNDHLYIKYRDLISEMNKSFSPLSEGEKVILSGKEVRRKCVEAFLSTIEKFSNYEDDELYEINYRVFDGLNKESNGLSFDMKSVDTLNYIESDEDVIKKIEKAIENYYKPYYSALSSYQIIRNNSSFMDKEAQQKILDAYIDGIKDEKIKQYVIKNKKK